MSCGLGEEERWILELLYKNRNMSVKRGYNSNKLKKLFRNKHGYEPTQGIRNLKNQGYIGVVGKNPEKYYIANKKETFYALGEHGVNVTKGRERPL